MKKDPIFLALALLGLIYLGAFVLGLATPKGERPAVYSAPPGDGIRPITAEEEGTAAANDALNRQSSGDPELQFFDVASKVGVDFTHSAFRWGLSGDPIAMMGGGLCWLDYDNNGWLDLYIVNS